MKNSYQITVGFDTSPLYSGHRVRGVGFYTKRLLEALGKIGGLKIKELRNEKEIRKADYDLLHIPYFHPYFLTLPFVKRKPLVITIHDLIPVKYPEHFPPGIKGRLRWEVQKKLLRRADAVITDSFASKKDIVKLTGYPKEKVHVIYLASGEEFKELNNLKEQKFKEKIREKYNLPRKFVLYVGDINWNKNVPSLVKAAWELEMPLVIVGKQATSKNFDRCHPENQDLVWLQENIDGEKVIALGFLSTEDLVAVYNLAAVYCQPSFDEGFGLPVLEAMQCGCPAVVSKRGSLPEIADKAAVLVKPTKRDIARGIKEAIKEEKKLRKKAFSWVKKFSWQKTAQETVSVYRRVLSGN